MHGQNVQVCYIVIHVPWWFAEPINSSSTLGISPNAVPPLAPASWQAPVCDVPLPVSVCSHCSTPTYEWEHVVFDFLFLCLFAENDGFQLHACPCKGRELILFYGCNSRKLRMFSFYIIIAYDNISLCTLSVGHKSNIGQWCVCFHYKSLCLSVCILFLIMSCILVLFVCNGDFTLPRWVVIEILLLLPSIYL